MLTPPVRALAFLGAAVPLLLSGTGCGRWMDYTPLQIQIRNRHPDEVYQRLIARSRSMGYAPEQVDPARRYFRVRAHLDQNRRRPNWRVSYFYVAVRPDGIVEVSAHGAHVRHGTRIHRNLCEELNAYMDSLSLEVGQPGPPGPPDAPLPPMVTEAY